MAKIGESWGSVAGLCAGLTAIGFGAAIAPGATEAAIGAGGLIGRVLGARQKFGPECDRTRRRIQESVRTGFTRMLEIEGDDWSAHPDLAEADAALSAALKGCMIDRRRLAAAAVSRAGFPEGAVAAVMEGLAAERPDLFSPEREGTLAHQYAGAVVSAGIRAAAENADWYRALEPDLILAIGQGVGETREEVKAGRAENREGFAALMAKMEALEARFGGAERVDETAERLHVSRPELLALLEAILEEETPEDQIDAALIRGRERLSETKAEIARLRRQGNEAPEAQADLEAAAAALARPDIADLAAAQEALALARARWLEGRARARAARAAEEAAARAREDATTFQFFTAEADLAKARLDHEGAARLLEAGAAEVEAGSRERMLLFRAAGDARAVAGGVVAGGPAHMHALEVARARLAAAPEDEERLRDVSVSLDRIGDVRVAAGDRAGALAAYEEGLAIARALAARDPGNADWARDVSVSLNRVGGVRVAEGDRAGALAAFEGHRRVSPRAIRGMRAGRGTSR
ncbi:MAG: hypothetical protein ACE37J_04850 [Pikeienuella sp.]|uniref:hypothetical protein n=1 Tax=Pikeienuella sp. TaxID=2831957 RepID=UPI00391BF10B